MRLIDERELIARIAELPDLRTISTATIGKIIKKCSTIDAVQVVRCRNCKHFMEYTNQHRFESAFDGDCRLLAGYTDCDREKRRYMDYCSDGVKMDGDVNAAD